MDMTYYFRTNGGEIESSSTEPPIGAEILDSCSLGRIYNLTNPEALRFAVLKLQEENDTLRRLSAYKARYRALSGLFDDLQRKFEGLKESALARD